MAFIDVPIDYWARGNIQVASALGIVEGYPDGTFRPEAALSRAEAATIAVRTLRVVGVVGVLAVVINLLTKKK